jgi:hypothetical protein
MKSAFRGPRYMPYGNRRSGVGETDYRHAHFDSLCRHCRCWCAIALKRATNAPIDTLGQASRA